MDAHDIERAGPSVAIETPAGDPLGSIRLTCAVPIPDGKTINDDGISTVEIPALAHAAVTVITGDAAHDGPDFYSGWDALRRWAEATSQTGTGEWRELYLDCDGPRNTWVVEVQMVLA